MSVVRADYRREFAFGCERILQQRLLPTIDDVNILYEHEAKQGRQDLQDPDCYSILLQLKRDCERVDGVLGFVDDGEQHLLSISEQVVNFYSTNSNRWGACFGQLLKEDTQGIVTRVHDVTGHFALVDIMKECLDDLKGFFARIGKTGISIRLGIATRKGALEHLRNQTRRLRGLGDDDQVSITDLRRSARLQINSTTQTETRQLQPDVELRQRHTLRETALPYHSTQSYLPDTSAPVQRRTEILPGYEELRAEGFQANDHSGLRAVDQEQYDNESHLFRRRGFRRVARHLSRLSHLVCQKIWVRGHLPIARTNLLCYAAVVSSSFCSAFACMGQDETTNNPRSDLYNGASQAILNILPAAIAVFNFLTKPGDQRPRLASSSWILICTVGGALSAVVSLLLTRRHPVLSTLFSYLANLLPVLSNFRIFTYTDNPSD